LDTRVVPLCPLVVVVVVPLLQLPCHTAALRRAHHGCLSGMLSPRHPPHLRHTAAPRPAHRSCRSGMLLLLLLLLLQARLL
jgi:hypothetical protein